MKKQFILMMSILGIALMVVSSCKKEQEVVIDPAVEAAELKAFNESIVGWPDLVTSISWALKEHKNPYGVWKIWQIKSGQKIDFFYEGVTKTGKLQKAPTVLEDPRVGMLNLRNGSITGKPERNSLGYFVVDTFKTVYYDPAELIPHLERIQLDVFPLYQGANGNFFSMESAPSLEFYKDYYLDAEIIMVRSPIKFVVEIYNADKSIRQTYYYKEDGVQWTKLRWK